MLSNTEDTLRVSITISDHLVESYLTILINMVEPKVNGISSNTVYSTIRISASLAMLMEHGYGINTRHLQHERKRELTHKSYDLRWTAA